MLRTRRQFLIHGIQVSAVLPMAQLHNFRPHSGDDETILVVIQLSGGNDGLNMVVPHAQDEYYKLRPTLALKPKSLHALDDGFGLHPNMGALAEVYAEGTMAVIHGVGYPQPNRSHFRSMDIWHSADLKDEQPTCGWLGRLADQMQAADPERLVALHVGSGELPLALYGQQAFAPTARDRKGFHLRGSDGFSRARTNMLDQSLGQNSELGFLHSAASNSYRAAERMDASVELDSSVDYPGYRLAQELKLVSQLISSHFGPRIFQLELTGFDTHVNQTRSHGELLGELSASLAAFQRDLKVSGTDTKVLTLVFSEFGRRVGENKSRGTDHGAAGPCLLVGRGVRAGMHGTPPDLRRLIDGDLPFGTDFRALYSTLEADWMKLASSTGLKSLELLS